MARFLCKKRERFLRFLWKFQVSLHVHEGRRADFKGRILRTSEQMKDLQGCENYRLKLFCYGTTMLVIPHLACLFHSLLGHCVLQDFAENLQALHATFRNISAARIKRRGPRPNSPAPACRRKKPQRGSADRHQR